MGPAVTRVCQDRGVWSEGGDRPAGGGVGLGKRKPPSLHPWATLDLLAVWESGKVGE